MKDIFTVLIYDKNLNHTVPGTNRYLEIGIGKWSVFKLNSLEENLKCL